MMNDKDLNIQDYKGHTSLSFVLEEYRYLGTKTLGVNSYLHAWWRRTRNCSQLLILKKKKIILVLTYY